MDYIEKYLKYKTKYIELKKNIKLNGGIIDVFNIFNIAENTEKKLDDVIAKEYIDSIKSYYKTQIDNHVHQLLGFIDLENSIYYLIDNIILNDKQIEMSKIILNNINIDDNIIENELYDDITKISQIELNIISFLKQNKNKLKYMKNILLNTTNKIFDYENCQITVNFIKLHQSGGFNPKIICFHSKMNGLIKIFSEPVIDFINNFVQSQYYKINMDGNKHKFPIKYGKFHKEISDKVSDDDLEKYYDMIIDIIYKKDMYGELDFVKNVLNDIKFSKDMLKNGLYIKEILLHHLLNNKYAHNGIDNFDILEKASKIIEKDVLDITNLIFVHSYLHYLDELNMYNDTKLMDINLDNDIKKLLRGCFKKSITIICYENLLNKNQYNFLEKSPSGKYKFPYRISVHALKDKKRQYNSFDDLYENFYEQISNSEKPIYTFNETDIPYGRYEYLKIIYNNKYSDIIDFIINNEELKKIKIINESTKFSDIIKIFNKKYKRFKKDDIINLILLYINNYVYIEEFSV
jgi:hypothetical protein